MRIRIITALFAVLCSISGTYAQLPVSRNIQAAFNKNTRSTSGEPGAAYWQNHASYNIQVEFEPATRAIAGSETIQYTNNSPDTLREIVFKLYPNIYQKGAPRLMDMEPAEVSEGVKITKMLINDQPQPTTQLRIAATNMSVILQTPLLPGKTLRFAIDYHYTLNKGAHLRTGQVDDGAWFLAYFFPRIAVYDDIDGWNRHPYLGTQEFYNDFCDFKTAITVPDNFIVWGTGDLTNCSEVLSPKYCERIAKAEKSDQIIDIIDSLDLKKGRITAPNIRNTFRFDARNVTDVAVAISDHYLWKAGSVEVDPATHRRTRAEAVFNPKHHDFFEVADFSVKTVKAMSYQFPKWPFPYPHITVFDGLDQMEYPMMVNDNPLEDRAEAIELTDHEIFHTMFPFYMGTNETKYGWMDEGWATIGEWLISPMIDSTIVDAYSIDRYEHIAGKETDLPVITPTTQLYGAPMMVNSYPKPALAYLYMKDYLGDERFFRALHHYIRTWNGKHPMPYDFFNCMNAGAGENLDWFWKQWFFEEGVPDLAITGFKDGKKTKSVRIESLGNKPVPVELTVFFTDGTSMKLNRTVEVWKNGNKSLEIPFKSNKQVQKILLGGTHSADINRKDNVWMVVPR